MPLRVSTYSTIPSSMLCCSSSVRRVCVSSNFFVPLSGGPSDSRDMDIHTCHAHVEVAVSVLVPPSRNGGRSANDHQASPHIEAGWSPSRMATLSACGSGTPCFFHFQTVSSVTLITFAKSCTVISWLNTFCSGSNGSRCCLTNIRTGLLPVLRTLRCLVDLM